MKVPFFKPDLPPYGRVEKDFREAYNNGWLGVPGKFTDRFEAAIKEYIGVRHVITVNNCSNALIAMLAHIPDGSKVIIPAYTFRATLQALEWNRLIPVVVDVDLVGNLSTSKVELAFLEEYGNDIKAILAVHIFGNPCYPRELEEIAAVNNVELFFDGAHAFGAMVNDVRIGNFGRAEAFSIAVTKPLAAGEGGIITTNDDSIAERVTNVIWHGLYGSLDTRYSGLNGHIQEINSIIGYYGLKNLDINLKRRRYLAQVYCESFTAGLNGLIECVDTEEIDGSAVKDFVIHTNKRNELIEYLNNNGIETKKYFYPAIPDMGTFNGIIHSAAVARRLANECVALPLYCSLTDKEQNYIINKIKGFFNVR